MLNAMFSIPMVQAISVKGLNTSLQTDYILKVYFSRLLVQSSISCLHLFFGEPLSILFFFSVLMCLTDPWYRYLRRHFGWRSCKKRHIWWSKEKVDHR